MKQANEITEAGGTLRLLPVYDRALLQSDAAFRLTDVVSEDDVLPLTASISRPLFMLAAAFSLQVGGLWRQHEKKHSQCA